jgi:hypothetical protein
MIETAGLQGRMCQLLDRSGHSPSSRAGLLTIVEHFISSRCEAEKVLTATGGRVESGDFELRRGSGGGIIPTQGIDALGLHLSLGQVVVEWLIRRLNVGVRPSQVVVGHRSSPI